ncbi:hypothetical protein RWH45_06615 [Microbacterium sp. KSW4-17]|uniref:Uncharacterized protein n=1 Tax=Microbacterium galbum TaxID=3075994 RepID=A0ABU3T698_9MICO|nr:hypothetical protein [Microbacterium sp. KSW4-17]MDU0366882.1 hypothetical protein [Microbacterium sp. KSW4-17]
MSKTKATPDAHKTAGAGGQSAGRDTLFWIIAGGLLITGVASTVMSLVLPSDQDELLPARILSNSLGVALTALSSAVVAYVLTRTVTVADVRHQHMLVLDRIARSLAHVHSNLQLATSQRRSRAFAHEETYQESVLASAASLLKEFDGVTLLSGSISGAFKDSKRDLDEIQSVLNSDQLVEQALTAARMEAAPVIADRVIVVCPQCSSRNSAHLALRPGWTAKVDCAKCSLRFNIHRKGDLTVYTSAPLLATQRPQRTGPELPDHALPPKELPVSEGDAAQPAVEELTVVTVTVSCPICGSTFNMRSRASQDGAAGTVKRVCTACGGVYGYDFDTRRITSSSSGGIEQGVIVGRSGTYARVACPVDKAELKASMPRPDGDWRAVCGRHLKVMNVTRAQVREWMRENDPVYLAERVLREQEGASRVLLDIDPR